MELIWECPETVTIPNIGTVRKGVKFSIEEDRGRDLIARGLASHPVVPKKTIAMKDNKGIDAAPQGKE